MTQIEPVTLTGSLVTLEPLAPSHHDELVAAVRDGEVWKLWYTAVPSPEQMGAESDRRLALQEAGSMLLELVDREDLLDPQYEAALRGITDWHRISAYKHPHESYLQEQDLLGPLHERLQALGEFVASLRVEDFLREHGLSEAELEAIRNRLA